MSLSQDARFVYEAALRAVDPRDLMRAPRVRQAVMELTDNSDVGIHVVGVGKAALPMLAGLELVGSRISGGVITIPKGYRGTWDGGISDGIHVVESDHPFPGAAAENAVETTVDYLRGLSDSAMVVVLISGGGSALWGAPLSGLSGELYRSLVHAAVKSTLSIGQLNYVRRSISRLANGRLAELVEPRQFRTFVLSDVPGGKAEDVASGPTVYRRVDCESLATLLQRLDVSMSAANLEMIARANADAGLGEIQEPIVIASNASFLAGASVKAAALGYQVTVHPNSLSGEARHAGKKIALDIITSEPGSCRLYGGETVVNVTGSGRGGRNQEVALAAAIELSDSTSGAVVLAASSDGIDGSSPGAGAVVDEFLVADSPLPASRCLENNDTDRYFRHTGRQIVTGPTHTNVLDIVIAIR